MVEGGPLKKRKEAGHREAPTLLSPLAGFTGLWHCDPAHTGILNEMLTCVNGNPLTRRAIVDIISHLRFELVGGAGDELQWTMEGMLGTITLVVSACSVRVRFAAVLLYHSQ